MKITNSFLKKIIKEELTKVTAESETRTSYHDRGIGRDELDKEAGFGDPEGEEPKDFESWIHEGDDRVDVEEARKDGIFLNPYNVSEYGQSPVETAKWWEENAKKYRKIYLPNFKNTLKNI
jgi:hypothetical protein